MILHSNSRFMHDLNTKNVKVYVWHSRLLEFQNSLQWRFYWASLKTNTQNTLEGNVRMILAQYQKSSLLHFGLLNYCEHFLLISNPAPKMVGIRYYEKRKSFCTSWKYVVWKWQKNYHRQRYCKRDFKILTAWSASRYRNHLALVLNAVRKIIAPFQ